MITTIMIALAYWIVGVVFALCGFCALGCLISLFLTVLYSFKKPTRILSVPLWIIFSFASLGCCWSMQWIYIKMGVHIGQTLQYWFIVGAIIPGILGFGFVPKLVGLATSNRNSLPPKPTELGKV
jgi:hypothetical protein